MREFNFLGQTGKELTQNGCESNGILVWKWAVVVTTQIVAEPREKLAIIYLFWNSGVVSKERNSSKTILDNDQVERVSA